MVLWQFDALIKTSSTSLKSCKKISERGLKQKSQTIPVLEGSTRERIINPSQGWRGVTVTVVTKNLFRFSTPKHKSQLDGEFHGAIQGIAAQIHLKGEFLTRRNLTGLAGWGCQT